MGGLVGRFWKSFGLTATIAIGISLLVSFTITPMLSSRLLKAPDKSGKGKSKESRFYALLERVYIAMLRWCLGHRAVVVILAIGLFFSTVMI